jgi:predicted amidophosphoribosyltransferase
MIVIKTVSASLTHAARGVLDMVLPPQCLACEALVSEPGALWASRWDGASFNAAPLCKACCLPFKFDQGPEALCGAYIRERPAFEWARAVFAYNDVSRDLVTGLKYRDRLHGAPAFGRWLAREAGKPCIVIPDLLRRTRVTPTQGGLSASQRRRNVRGAFAVNPRYADRIAGVRLLLVDDVYSTGATLEDCARVLLRARASAADALVLVRVDRPASPGN